MARRLERLLEIIEEYRQKNSESPIVVEGRNDVRSLRKLGFLGDIVCINSGQSLVNLVEDLARRNDEVIVLTDFDRTGEILKDKLCNYVQAQGKMADLYLWNYIRSMGIATSIEEVHGAVVKMVEKSMNVKTISMESVAMAKRTASLERRYT